MKRQNWPFLRIFQGFCRPGSGNGRVAAYHSQSIIAQGPANSLRYLGCLLLSLWCITSVVYAATPVLQVRTTSGEFDDVRERVVMALENRGLVLSYTARVGDMLERTGRDLGDDRPIYGKAETLEFCSAAISRETMAADPRNIVFCPYAIAVYTLPQEPRTVYLAYRVPVASGAVSRNAASVRALRKVEKLLADVVSEAMK